MGVRRLPLKRVGITPQASWGPDFPSPRSTCLPRVNQRPGPLTLPCHSIAGLLPVGSVGPEGLSLANWIRPGRVRGGTGISTSCPSITPRGLTLGPD